MANADREEEEDSFSEKKRKFFPLKAKIPLRAVVPDFTALAA